MPFLIPSRLIEFEYLGGSTDNSEYENLARGYQHEIDLAFFVTNFNYSKEDYYQLTPRERAFILKAWESKLVTDTTHLRNAVLNAISNAFKKKGSRFVDLWKKKSKPVDMEIVTENIRIVNKLEEDKSWVDKIYQANGMKRPQRQEG